MDCTNLRTVKLSEELKSISQYLFYNCYNLSIIKTFSGKTEKFGLKYDIKEGEKTLNMKDLRKIKNLGTLSIPSTITEIIEDDYDISENLQCIIGDPKWLAYFPAYQITTFIVPSFVKKIDETNFKDCEKLEYIQFKGKIELEGKKCRNLENVLTFKCFKGIIGASQDLKESKKIIEIDECQQIEKKSFKNWIGIEYLFLPKNLKRIESYAFYGCKNLYELEIPESVEYIDITSFEGCTNLRKIICDGKFLRCFPSKNIKFIKLNSETQNSDVDNLEKFENLEVLELPENINNLNVNLPKLNSIKCSGKVLETIPTNIKKNLQNIELYDENLTEKMLKKCDNAQNYIVAPDCKTKIETIKDNYQTSIDDIINIDEDNKKYEKYLRNMVKDIKNENISTKYNKDDKLGELSNLISRICIQIKKSKKICPHQVQCFAILKILDKILRNDNKKGVLAEIQTGEGKSFIIAVVAIALANKGKKIDIVTTTLELAFRDEKNQSKLYKEFGLKSGVLCNDNDEEYINLYKPDYKNEKIEGKSGFYLHVLEYPIVYSTNFNYQHLHLYSLFEKEKIRKRIYDIAIIDEVDNMIMDQIVNPAVIGNPMKLYKYEEILKDIYDMSDAKENYILDKLNKKYKDISNLNLEIIQNCKKSAKTANQYKRDIEYIIEGEKVIIMDNNTGYKKPSQRCLEKQTGSEKNANVMNTSDRLWG